MSGRSIIRGKKLYQLLFYGVILVVISLAVLVFWGVREVRHDAGVVAVESATRGLSGTITVLVNAVTRSNEEIGTKVFASMDPAWLERTFSAVLKQHPSLVAIMVSDSQGVKYFLRHRSDGLIEIIPNSAGTTGVHAELIAPDGKRKDVSGEYGFNRKAADLVLAEEFAHLKPGQVNWRSAARFHETGESWLTASSLVAAEGSHYMVSYVFPVKAVIDQLVGAEKGLAEKVFLYWTSGKVYPVVSEGSTIVDADAPAHASMADPVIEAATKLLENASKRTAPFVFRAQGEIWWGYLSPLSVFGDTMSLGVLVPQRRIISDLTGDTFLQIFGGVLVLATAIVLFFIHKNRVRIESIGLRHSAVQSADEVLQLIAEGESSALEFKQTLRFNLKAGKNGREIEHASMKTVAGFLNSDGGTLLVGVADSGEITGFKEDKFENEDKALLHFNNLVNQQIGTEFSRYVDTAIIPVNGQLVLRVYCLPASAPAILMNGKNEEFYIRSGPASRQLTLSQFYEWLQGHSM